MVLFFVVPPPDVFGSFLNRLVLSVENVAGLLEGSIDLVEGVIIRHGRGPRESNFRSTLCLSVRLRAGSEIAKLLF